jgi:ubiquinone/menaquinone biosynthesis C-methylase UbiE
LNSFDERAATWDDPAKIERAAAIARVIRQAISLDTAMRYLEYGAGTGLVTQALQSTLGPVTLADTSAGMRDVMADKVASGILPGARIWDLDLSTDEPPDEQFDLIVTVLTLHHIPDIDRVLMWFATLLADAGHVCIVDLEAEDGSFHGDSFEGHRGFERSALTGRLEAAGFTDVSFQPCHYITRDSGVYPLFLATAWIEDTP